MRTLLVRAEAGQTRAVYSTMPPRRASNKHWASGRSMLPR
jgi:hypothetical protein